MIEYDERERRIVLKLVYYGPALSGKTTNLLSLHDLLAREGRGDLMMLDTHEDRTLFFDLLPLFLVTPGGLRIKIKVYTVPGQVRHDATRKAVLSRADGVVFVADSQERERRNNAESFENLERNLEYVGLAVDSLPLVIQFNKRDLPRTVPDEEIDATWGSTGLPVIRASALYGKGVIETYRAMLGGVYRALDPRFGFAEREALTETGFVESLTRVRASAPAQGA